MQVCYLCYEVALTGREGGGWPVCRFHLGPQCNKKETVKHSCVILGAGRGWSRAVSVWL